VGTEELPASFVETAISQWRSNPCLLLKAIGLISIQIVLTYPFLAIKAKSRHCREILRFGTADTVDTAEFLRVYLTTEFNQSILHWWG